MAKKHAVRPTRRQKQIIRENKLLPDSWLVKAEHDGIIYLESRSTKRIRRIPVKGCE